MLFERRQVLRLAEVAAELGAVHDIREVNLVLFFLDAVVELVGQEEFDELLFDNVRRHGGEKACFCVARLDVELKWLLCGFRRSHSVFLELVDDLFSQLLLFLPLL